LALGASACADDDGGSPDTNPDSVPDTSLVDDADVPFDPDVGPGIDTDTDEGGNLGFDDVEP
jgi:hypothetical protein